jgi:glycosyltransferase involved in cell wall biosynthesis
VQHPFWGRVLRRGDFTRIAYDCIDELSLFSGKSSLARAEQSQKQLLAISDVVFATAEKLEDNLRPKSAPVPLLRIPNGVDSAWFQSQASMHPAPGDVRSLRKPVVGYVGVLRGWFDYELVGWLAREMPDVSFVMVGPVDFEWRLAALRGIENLHWLGRREYRDMPLYIQSFDVCLIPFLAGDVSMTTNPVKVLEYFALGKPVVSTPLHELEGYRNEKLLWMAESRDEFAAALREALAESNAIAGERRRQVARAHEWRSLARTMLDALGAPMGARP